MRVAIAGGTGMVGRRVAKELRLHGHDVRVLSRSADEHRVDLTTGAGLDRALDGCDVVVDATNGSSTKAAVATLIDGSRRLLAAEEAAGVRHHVCVSIVGCDVAPMGYFKAKTRQEAIVAEGPVPWTIVRVTQFHEFVASNFDMFARWRVLPLPRALVQSVAGWEAAQAVADIALGAPLGKRIDVAGPEVVDVRQSARTWRSITGRRVPLLTVPLPGALGRRLRSGVLTSRRPDVRGTIPFAEWLTAQQW